MPIIVSPKHSIGVQKHKPNWEFSCIISSHSLALLVFHYSSTSLQKVSGFFKTLETSLLSIVQQGRFFGSLVDDLRN